MLWNTGVKGDDGFDIFIPRADFARYVDDYFWEALHVWIMTENMQCLPFSGGWAEQPAPVAQVVNLFRTEQSRWEQEELERERTQPKPKP